MHELFSLIGNVLINKNQAQQDIDQVTGHAQKAEPKIGGAMKKIALAIGGAFAIGKIVQFGKKIIETAANLQAMRAQFDQVFGKDAAEAQAKILEQSKQLGIHTDRLTDSWNKFGAQTKGAGMDAAQSMEATDKATRLAADSAAFYDTALDQSTASIASFMKGNFAAGDAIGVFTNAKQMDGKANEKYGKSWADLTEAERQYLLLDTIEKTYEMNGAMGQAARESESWANQTGNLKAAWDGFLAKIGTPILAVAVKAVGALTKGVEWLAIQAETYLVPAFNSMFENVSGKLLPIFKALKNWFAANWPIIKDAVLDAYKAIKPAFDAISDAIESFMIPIMEYLGEIITEVLIPIFLDLKDMFEEAWPKITKAVQNAYDRIKPAFDELIQAMRDYLIPIIKDLWERFKEAWPSIQKIFEAVFPVIVGFIELAIDTIKTIIKVAAGIYDDIKPGLDKAGGIFGTVFKGIERVINAVGTALQWAIDLLNIWNKTELAEKNPNKSTTNLSKSGNTHGGLGRDLPAPKTTSRNLMYDVGSRYIPYDMTATIHEGEMIVPKSENPYANSGGKIMPDDNQGSSRMIQLLEMLLQKDNNVYLDGRELTRGMYPYIDEALVDSDSNGRMATGGAY